MACVCTRSDCWDQMTINQLRKENIMKAFITVLTIALAACVLTGYAREYHISPVDLDENKRMVSAFKTEFTTPPKRMPSRTSVDGPLLGNGVRVQRVLGTKKSS